MADGAEYDLPAVKPAPRGAADVDVNKALAAAPPTIASHLSEYGSAALTYTYPLPGVAVGQITMIDVPRSLIFTDGFEMMMLPMMSQNSPAKQRLQGLWWKRNADVGGFVNLANTTGSSVKLRLQVTGAHGVTRQRLPGGIPSNPQNGH